MKQGKQGLKLLELTIPEISKFSKTQKEYVESIIDGAFINGRMNGMEELYTKICKI